MTLKHTRIHGSFVLNKSFNTNIGDKPVNELSRMNSLKSLTEQPTSSKNNMHEFEIVYIYLKKRKKKATFYNII